MLGIQVVNQTKWPTYHTRPSLCVHRKHTNLCYWEPVATGNLVCYLVFGYCGKGWKWLHGNGILTETKFVCQSVTAMLGCRKYKLSILLLKGSRALPGVDNGCIVGSKYPFKKCFCYCTYTAASSYWCGFGQTTFFHPTCIYIMCIAEFAIVYNNFIAPVS